MKRARWRLPEAPRPSRTTSRGTAAFVCLAAVVLGLPAASWAGETILLEPEGRPLCSQQAGPRNVTTVLQDLEEGLVLLTRDTHAYLRLPGGDDDAYLIHLDRDLRTVPFGDAPDASSPCGALLMGGEGTQLSAGGAFVAPDRLAVVIQSVADTGPDVSQVFVQSYDGAGHGLFGPSPLRVSDPRGESRFPFLVPDGSGGLFIAWTEEPVGPTSLPGDVFVNRLDAGGLASWGQRTLVSSGVIGGAGWSVLAADGEGGVYVSFAEPTGAGGYERIHVQRIGADGATLWSPGGVFPWDGDRADDLHSSIVSDGPDGVIVVFAADGQVRAQKLSPAGTRLWGPDGLVLSEPHDPDPTPFGDASEPRIVALGTDSLYVTWTERREIGVEALVARRLERDGRLPWPRPATLAAHDAGLWNRRESVLPDGTLAVVWEDGRSARIDPPDGADIYTQAVDSRGRVKGPRTGLPVIVAAGEQLSPFVTAPGRPFATPAGVDASLPQALIVWSDSRFTPVGTPWLSESLVAQVVAFGSSPRVVPVPPSEVREDSEATIVLRGDDLQPGLVASAGAGIAIEATATPDSPDAPGDTLTLRLRVGTAPGAAPGLHDLSIVNPDGGALVLPAVLSVTLDPRRVDVDRSGRVDGFDLALLARSFGGRLGDDLYAGRADIDADGLVDGSDLALLAARFGDSIAADGGDARAR